MKNWKIKYSTHFGDKVVNECGETVARLSCPANNKTAGKDALLIAAAPELLAALEWAAKNIEEIAIPEMGKQGRVTSLNNALDKARAAIAKAKGE